MSSITQEVALKRLAQVCAENELSRADVFRKMRKWGIERELVKSLLKTLEENDFVNDERFCRSYVNDKLRLSKWGRLKILEGLKKKDISEEIVERYLYTIDEDEYFDILCGIINVKKRSVRAKNEEELNVKLARFALSRGFEMEYIERCLGELPEDAI